MNKNPNLTPPLKWHGGKHYMTGQIVAMIPSHKHYVEPFAGGLSVLLARDPQGVSEVVNDSNGLLMNFWCCLQDAGSFSEFARQVEAIPFSEPHWKEARERLKLPCPHSHDEPCVACGVAFFILCRQSLAGRMDTFAPLSRTRTRRRMNEQASAWLTTVEGLPAVHARLKRVVVLCKDASVVIKQQDGEATLFYLDPPYLHETRSSTKEYGPHEMTTEDHTRLLGLIKQVKGKVILSGYFSELYNRELVGWHRETFDLPNNAASGASKARETEVVWRNYQ